MPAGSGPTNPDHVWQAIHNGASYSGGLLNGCHLTIDRSNVWELSTGIGYTLSQAAYDAMLNGTTQNKLIVVGAFTWQLAPNTSGVADLAPPPP